MSHFPVLVIHETEDQVERLLAPFQENNMGDCPKEFLKFFDVEDEARSEYETESVEMLKTPTGSHVYTWIDENTSRRIRAGESVEGYSLMNVPHKERFKTFEGFCKDYKDFDRRDPETKRYGYWENPNAKWDWYIVGGRWNRILPLKSGERTNSSHLKDIAFDENFWVWALLTHDGEWKEQGKMGWWAMNDATDASKTTFFEGFRAYLKNVPGDYYATVVDCHI